METRSLPRAQRKSWKWCVKTEEFLEETRHAAAGCREGKITEKMGTSKLWKNITGKDVLKWGVLISGIITRHGGELKVGITKKIFPAAEKGNICCTQQPSPGGG